MYYREFAPGEDAGRFVERYWVLEDAAPGTVQRVVPDGRPELILNLGQPFESLQNGLWERQPRCFLAGQLTGPLHLRAPGTTRILGVRFRPGGAAQLLGMPMQELTDRVVPASDLGLASLAERATLPDVECALLRLERGQSDPLVDEAARLLARYPDVAAAAALLGVSPRQLERRFKTRVGMAPKYFARIRRFQRVFHAMEDAAGGGWVDAAAACGYYDQAHLIRDFRTFAGEPPSHLLAADDLARHFLSHFSKTHSSRRA
jgi:AraC-like DNA-binding protein